MSETEPVLLRDQADGPVPSPAPAMRPSEPPARAYRQTPAVYVVGFWKRFVAAAIDFAVIVPVALIITWLVGAISGVHLPAETLHLLDVDLWIDLLLATDPAIIMALVLFIAIGMTYLLVF